MDEFGDAIAMEAFKKLEGRSKIIVIVVAGSSDLAKIPFYRFFYATYSLLSRAASTIGSK